jgi:hypothetical protein
MSDSGCRPAVVTSASSRKRLPAFGPRLTTSSALPGGSASVGASGWSAARRCPPPRAHPRGRPGRSSRCCPPAATARAPFAGPSRNRCRSGHCQGSDGRIGCTAQRAPPGCVGRGQDPPDPAVAGAVREDIGPRDGGCGPPPASAANLAGREPKGQPDLDTRGVVDLDLSMRRRPPKRRTNRVIQR